MPREFSTGTPTKSADGIKKRARRKAPGQLATHASIKGEDRTMVAQKELAPAMELAKKNGVRLPNESDAYRRARDALLAEEIELRRHIERVAEQRRALPPGGEVTKTYAFQSEHG